MKIEPMSIKLLITGGTIDKRYNPLNGELTLTESSVQSMLNQGRTEIAITLETIMLKDSLEIDNNDRQKILQHCLTHSGKRIIITHGTDTMVQTAKVLAQNISDKTIVLLGAMLPYQFKHSDALFNLGCAVAAVQALDDGIYITMNGQIFNHDQVIKNTVDGKFQHQP